MKRFIAAIILCLSACNPALAAAARDVSSTEAKAVVDKAKNAFILDVRSPQERSQGYIPGSQLIPIDTIERRLAEIPSPDKQDKCVNEDIFCQKNQKISSNLLKTGR